MKPFLSANRLRNPNFLLSKHFEKNFIICYSVFFAANLACIKTEAKRMEKYSTEVSKIVMKMSFHECIFLFCCKIK